MNYFGGGYMGGGYMDPLGSGRRPMQGFGTAMASVPIPGVVGGPGGPGAPPPMIGFQPTPRGGSAMPAHLQGGKKGIGSYIGGALDWMGGGLDWLTDDENGAERISALTNVAGLGMGIYGAHQDRKEARRQQERTESLEEERLANYRSWDPERQRLFAQMLARRGG